MTRISPHGRNITRSWPDGYVPWPTDILEDWIRRILGKAPREYIPDRSRDRRAWDPWNMGDPDNHPH